jgi:hypothetical protein
MCTYACMQKHISVAYTSISAYVHMLRVESTYVYMLKVHMHAHMTHLSESSDRSGWQKTPRPPSCGKNNEKNQTKVHLEIASNLNLVIHFTSTDHHHSIHRYEYKVMMQSETWKHWLASKTLHWFQNTQLATQWIQHKRIHALFSLLCRRMLTCALPLA